MQANKLSAYNTKTANTEKKIERVNGKLVHKSVTVKPAAEPVTGRCKTKPQISNFDFAGLAG